MHYYSVNEAREMKGVRLVLSEGQPNPFGEVVKGMFHLKGISYIPVAQHVGEENEDLRAWTGLRNAPVVVVDDQKPIDRWLDILMLAERLSSQPKLLPDASEERLIVVGLGNEICGEWGLGWVRRVMFLSHIEGSSPQLERIRKAYGVTLEAAKRAPARLTAILGMLTDRLKVQRAHGSQYLVGDALTAADLYWAYFSIALNPLSHEAAPMPESLRALYESSSPELDAAKDPILFEHRDMILRRYGRLPLVF